MRLLDPTRQELEKVEGSIRRVSMITSSLPQCSLSSDERSWWPKPGEGLTSESEWGRPGRREIQGKCGGRRLPPTHSTLRREHGNAWTSHCF